MRIPGIAVLTLLSAAAIAQNMPNGEVVSHTATRYRENQINEGVATKGKTAVHCLMVIYTGDIDNLIKQLSSDLGRLEIVHEDPTYRQLDIKNIKRPEWSEKRLVLGFAAHSNGDRHMINITCTDFKGYDYLMPKSDTQVKIKAYLAAVLNKGS